MEPQMQAPQMQGNKAPEDMGRGTDTVMAHLSLGEVVVPRAFLDDPQVMEMLKVVFEQNQTNMAEFTVGDPSNKINPETGYPEFFKIGKALGSIAKFAVPLAASYFAPGIGTALSSGLGLGLTGASSLGALGGAAGGLAGGLLSGGGLKGALTGAALGGAGGYLSNGGFSENLGRLPGGSLQGATTSGAPLSGVGQGEGLLGSLGRSTGLNTGSLGGLVGGSSGGGSSFGGLNLAANAIGGLSQDSALKKQQKQLLESNNQQIANLDSFDPSGITNDPGYKFRLEQGQEGLNKQLAASGALGSGRAIQAAAQYNQDYADNAFQNYYQRWMQRTQGQNQLLGNSGDIRAQATGQKSQNLAQSLSNALGSKVGSYGQGIDQDQLRRLLAGQ
jgi:hypothetical protein